MKCTCGGRLYVRDVAQRRKTVSRRKKCKDCGKIIYTVERIDDSGYAKAALNLKRKKETK